MNITWIGGNVDWVDGNGNNANWNPADEPDSNDAAVFNTSNGVNLGSNNTVNGLTMSGGIDLSTNGFDLTVDGLVQLTGGSTNLYIGGAAGSVDADNVTINSGGTVELSGGSLIMNEEVGTALIDINAGGTLQGNGVISFVDSPGVATTILVNDGTLTALSRGITIFSPPPVGTLSIPSAGLSRVDLDGSGLELGVVNVNRNQTLDLNPAMSDSFNGTMNLFHNSTFDSLSGWTLGTGGSLVADNGFVAGGLGFSDILADTSFIKGGPLTQTGGTINVVDTDGTLQIDANFTMSGGSFTNSGTAIFNGVTNITTAAGYDPTALNAQTIINANFTVNDAAGNFDWDGNGASDTTINGGALMSITANQVDTTDNVFGGTITLNGGSDLTVNVAATSWTMGGSLVKNDAGTSVVSGDRVVITGAVDANAGTLDMPAVTTSVGSSLTIGGTMTLGGTSELAGGTITGTGTLLMEGTSTVTANTTIGVATFDWDGTGSGTTHTIDSGVTFTINSTTFDTDGDMDDPINVGGNGGTLAVNNVPSWTMNRTLTTNSTGVGITSLNGTSRMILSGALGIWNADGQTAVNAPVTLGASSTVNIAGGGFIRLNGGSGSGNFNRIEGAVVNGPGGFLAINDRQLRGFGTINAPVTFENTSQLLADDGTLTINGAINQVGTIGTADNDGVLNVTNAWNTNVATSVTLNGGVLQGGTITVANTNGIVGHGLISARVINNTRIRSQSVGQTLLLQTPANDNDWDGAGNTGILHASTFGDLLELRDNVTFGFGGSVRSDPGTRVFTNGFALDFNPGSNLQLSNGTYESTNSTDIGGTVTVNAGLESKIKVANNSFLTFEAGSSTTLNANLRLENNNIIIEQGAVFNNGGGSLVIPDGSHMVGENLADIGVLLQMDGAFRPGNSEGIGRVNLFDYQQGNTGELFVELTGTALNAFDRLVASGDVVLDGFLSIDIDGGFVPTLGQTFNIITGNTVSGTFDYADVSGMPADLAFHIAYLGNIVQLQVVNKPFFSADFDDDGDVDATDLSIWQNAYNLNQLGDADGDNDSDGRDFLIWQQQVGSAPLVALSAVASVPEPAGFTIGLMALCLLSVNRRYS